MIGPLTAADLLGILGVIMGGGIIALAIVVTIALILTGPRRPR